MDKKSLLMSRLRRRVKRAYQIGNVHLNKIGLNHAVEIFRQWMGVRPSWPTVGGWPVAGFILWAIGC